jgi:cobyrinic acid a,c-diamide synthase
MTEKIPRLLIAGLSGDSGKTIVSLSLLKAFIQKGLKVSAFKKGPDYIDSAWLSYFSGSACRNLDTYLFDTDSAYHSFVNHAASSDLAIIEGNRGIHDGKDVDGTHSTAELAKLLQTPAVLVVDSTKSTRTLAALVKGCIEFDPDVEFAGVILNRIAGDRHRRIVAESIEKYCNMPVLGCIPRLEKESTIIPGRHLGLITPSEYREKNELNQALHEISEKYLDIDALLKIANGTKPLEYHEPVRTSDEKKVSIGYFKDSVFTFYYPENLEALKAAGAELIEISSLHDRCLPDIDALYIGGGFPETHAEKLVRNAPMMISVKKAVETGLPVYAECGGLVYLSRSLLLDDNRYPMADIFPIDLKMHDKPIGHGYALLETDIDNPFFERGFEIRGHEFHYSGLSAGLDISGTCLRVKTGYGLNGQRDGLICKNTLACYTHIHALGIERWASSMVGKAIDFKSIKAKTETATDCRGESCVPLI